MSFARHADTGLYYRDASGMPDESVTLEADDLAKDSTGVATIWPATTLLISYLEQEHEWLHRLTSDGAIELGAGLGIAGMYLATRLAGVPVTLTDYHPLVLQALHAAVAKNELTSRCAVARLDWDAPESVVRRCSLVIGADLAVSARAAASLASAVTRTISHRGVFVYAHTVRRAIFLEAGELAQEATDSALEALCAALRAGERGLQVRQLSPHADGTPSGGALVAPLAPPAACARLGFSSRGGCGAGGSAGGEEDSVLLAFGLPEALDEVASDPGWSAAWELLASKKRKLAALEREAAELLLENEELSAAPCAAPTAQMPSKPASLEQVGASAPSI
jgi:hypothetical protein